MCVCCRRTEGDMARYVPRNQRGRHFLFRSSKGASPSPQAGWPWQEPRCRVCCRITKGSWKNVPKQRTRTPLSVPRPAAFGDGLAPLEFGIGNIGLVRCLDTASPQPFCSSAAHRTPLFLPTARRRRRRLLRRRVLFCPFRRIGVG